MPFPPRASIVAPLTEAVPELTAAAPTAATAVFRKRRRNRNPDADQPAIFYGELQLVTNVPNMIILNGELFDVRWQA